MAAFRVLGVDPGTRTAGWAVLEQMGRGTVSHLASGALKLGGSSVPLPDRLLRLRSGIVELLAEWSPGLLAVEAAFFGKNARSALRLGEARGTVLVTAREAGLQLAEIPPAQVKRRVAGNGGASKEQVARLVRLRLRAPADFSSTDQSDAVAVALCFLLERDSPAAAQGVRKGRRARLPKGAEVQ